ncbi:hypothetical protein [Rickettsia endosymbiont of Orchestes rusci]|uniref:hypothetical protein n=1 Tax=Rickettsia endosymbiont of Orchestes rusci TaxID=3066250 RepID=UPI00313ED280
MHGSIKAAVCHSRAGGNDIKNSRHATTPEGRSLERQSRKNSHPEFISGSITKMLKRVQHDEY